MVQFIEENASPSYSGTQGNHEKFTMEGEAGKSKQAVGRVLVLMLVRPFLFHFRVEERACKDD